MRIGVNALFLIPGDVGGSEYHLRGLLHAMQDRAPHELVVFTNRENHASFAAFERIATGVAARSRVRRVVAEQRVLPRLAKRHGIDVLYSPGYTAPLHAHCPQVVGILDTQFVDHPDDFSWLSRAAQRYLIGRAARRAHAITTLSEFSRQRIHRHLGVPPDRIVVTYSGVDDAFTAPQPAPVDLPYLLYVARTYPHKNAARLVRAFDSIADRIPHRLVICGRPDRGEPPAHPRVTRLHQVSQAELVGLMQHADLLVHASLYEGFGRPLIEAQMAGTRIVAANAAATPEVAGDGATYFDPDDESDISQAMLQALNESQPEREAIVAAGRANADRFTWAAVADRTLHAIGRARGGGAQDGI